MITIAFLLPGGLDIDIGYGDYLVLDGSGSKDPDDSSDDSVYEWDCYDSDGLGCTFDYDPVILEDSAKINKSVASFLESGKT